MDIFVISGYEMATLQLDWGYNAKIKTLEDITKREIGSSPVHLN
jgi:hypothetical protein